MSDTATDSKVKKERSPSYPFISVKKAEERAKQFWDKHRREAARLSAVAPTWKYEQKSSGFAQTIGALKQYGLLEDVGRGEDRKIQLSELGRRLVADQRQGAREAALKEAATKPPLFQEYARWINDPPSEGHRLSELELDRGFNEAAARLFLRAFDETATYAGLAEGDSLSSNLDDGRQETSEMNQTNEEREGTSDFPPAVSNDLFQQFAPGPRRLPLAQRLKVEVTAGAVRVSATLMDAGEVDKLIRILEANKLMLAEDDGPPN